eukprot:Rmarinus@m.9535
MSNSKLHCFKILRNITKPLLGRCPRRLLATSTSSADDNFSAWMNLGNEGNGDTPLPQASYSVTPRTLYVCSTPIGNMFDISLRTLYVLQGVDVIAAEDTRTTVGLLKKFGVVTPLLSFHAHNERQRIPQLLSMLQAGKSVAVVSDAGTPCFSDPGSSIVKACIAEDLPVTPVPGACAWIAAASASGCPLHDVRYVGFLPRKSHAKQLFFREVRMAPWTLAFYEAPHRLQFTLEELLEELGPARRIVVARQLTKPTEHFFRGTTVEAVEWYKKKRPRGEITILVEPCGKRKPNARVRQYRHSGAAAEADSEEENDVI